MASETVGSGDYLQGWHDRHPGATSAMLDSVTDELGRNTYEMLSDVIQDGDDPILDLACGDGYLLELLHPSHACVGMDWNIAELDAAFRRRAHGAPLVRANAAGLPIATATFGAITCHYSSMLLQPLETVLAVVARSLRSGGLLATMLPAPPIGDAPNPISVFRSAWQEVSRAYPIDIPSFQDDRALELESLKGLLTSTGFRSVSAQSFAVSKAMTVDEAISFFLLTCLPELLPPAGYADLTRLLRVELDKLAGVIGTVTVVVQSALVTARRR